MISNRNFRFNSQRKNLVKLIEWDLKSRAILWCKISWNSTIKEISRLLHLGNVDKPAHPQFTAQQAPEGKKKSYNIINSIAVRWRFRYRTDTRNFLFYLLYFAVSVFYVVMVESWVRICRKTSSHTGRSMPNWRYIKSCTWRCLKWDSLRMIQGLSQGSAK